MKKNTIKLPELFFNKKLLCENKQTLVYRRINWCSISKEGRVLEFFIYKQICVPVFFVSGRSLKIFCEKNSQQSNL